MREVAPPEFLGRIPLFELFTIRRMVSCMSHTQPRDLADRLALRDRGLRVTVGRLAVLDVLTDFPHSDAEQVHRILGERVSGGQTLQAVHNMLADLTEAGLLRRFVPARCSARYERRIGDNHHHAVCNGCGQIYDVDCVIGVAPCLAGPTPTGFVVETAEITFTGRCASCAALETQEGK